MSANISNISEHDFEVLASAAQDAKDRGNAASAEALDKLARKANAALTNAKYAGLRRFGAGARITWKSVPSTLL